MPSNDQKVVVRCFMTSVDGFAAGTKQLWTLALPLVEWQRHQSMHPMPSPY